MSFYTDLQKETAEARGRLLASDVIVDCLNHRVSPASYRAFLTEAYHHVRHTVPLLMACGSRLPDRLGWLQKHIVQYVDEELGHELWIRNDLAATGVDPDQLLAAGPGIATELMVSYAYDTVQRGNPVGFFGMVYVLESTSVAIATQAAKIIQSELELPKQAFSYLLSHGSVDVKHIEDFAAIVDRFDAAGDRAAVIHRARIFCKLYADVFAGLPRATAAGDALPGDRRLVA